MTSDLSTVNAYEEKQALYSRPLGGYAASPLDVAPRSVASCPA